MDSTLKKLSELNTSNAERLPNGKFLEFRKNGSKRVFTLNAEPSLADQSQSDECDVNNIMDKYLKTGQVTHLSSMQGQFADVSDIPDLHTAMNQVTLAEQTFQQLPAELREKFHNPLGMVKFLQDPRNVEESIELGLREINHPSTDSQILHSLNTLNNNIVNTEASLINNSDSAPKTKTASKNNDKKS